MSKIQYNLQDSKSLELSLFREVDISFIKKKSSVSFFNDLIVYSQDKKCFFYNPKEKKIEYTIPINCGFPCQICKTKIALICYSFFLILNYDTKRLIYAFIADFNYVFHAICIKEKTLVILGGGSVYIFDFDTRKCVGIRYPNFMELTADTRSLVPVNEELLLIIMRSIEKGPYYYLLNWKTKQILTIIYNNVSYINRFSGKIEKGFDDKKKISRTKAGLVVPNIKEIFTFNTKVNHYIDSLKLKFIINIFNDRIIGFVEEVYDDIAIKIIDIQNFQILQNVFDSGVIYDFFHNDRFFIFKNAGRGLVCYELNYENLEKYLQKK